MKFRLFAVQLPAVDIAYFIRTKRGSIYFNFFYVFTLCINPRLLFVCLIYFDIKLTHGGEHWYNTNAIERYLYR